MDWIIWLIVIVVIVGVVWFLLNRNSARSGASTSTGAGTSATPPVPAGREPEGGPRPEAAAAPGLEPAGPAGAAGGTKEGSEWETEWSETPPAEPHTASSRDVSRGAHPVRPAADERPAAAAPLADAGERPAPATTEPARTEPARTEHPPAHHPEYTEPHAPTLPGAESAAAELADAETLQTEASVAATEGSASHGPAPARHLALDQPYGEGSAAPGPDGSGPEGFTVKGNASSMIYHDETSPSYDETRAEVWFLSAAHAEAAGFRPPRRSRL